MRARFFAPDDEEETASHARLLQGFDAFWSAFRRVASQPSQDWIGDLRASLGGVHAQLGLEVQSNPDGTRTLFVLPLDGPAAPLAELCLERAPRRAPWMFEGKRPPLELERALALMRSVDGLELENARARVGVTRGHLLDIVLASSEFDAGGDEAEAAAERFVRLLVGDECFDAWVSSVAIRAAPRASPLRVVGPGELRALPLALAELPDAIAAAGRGILFGLPEQPLHAFCEHAEWTLFELDETLRVSDSARVASLGLEPDETPDLCSLPPQSDLLVACTFCPEALKCLLSGQPFSSKRFSRHGERFCYLKLKVDVANDEARVHFRTELEDVLDRALVPGRLGCVVGSGLGREHVYIDLALSKLEPALDVIRARLERSGVDKDAWLFFFDDEWSNEWVAMAPGAGRPRTR